MKPIVRSVAISASASWRIRMLPIVTARMTVATAATAAASVVVAMPK